MKYKYTKENLQQAVSNSNSVSQVMRTLGIKVTGGNHSHISRRLKFWKIDCSHFTGQASNIGGKYTIKLPASDVLVVFKDRRKPVNQLRRALLEIGIKYECVLCNNKGFWNNKKLVLEIDHISGDWSDNTRENLRFLCPNCHAQETKIKRKPKKIRRKKYAKSIYVEYKRKTKIQWPSNEELQRLVWQKPSLVLAKELGVSDKAIEKRCKKFGITKPNRGYWMKNVGVV